MAIEIHISKCFYSYKFFFLENPSLNPQFGGHPLEYLNWIRKEDFANTDMFPNMVDNLVSGPFSVWSKLSSLLPSRTGRVGWSTFYVFLKIIIEKEILLIIVV